MATEYWNYWDSGTSGTTATSGGAWSTDPCTSGTTSGSTWWIRIVRKYLVVIPENWTEKIIADFTILLNDKTNTGFRVEMVIRGDIKITDHTIEVRTMENFIPLLRQYAGKKDLTKIKKFFKKNGPDPETP